MPRTRCFLCGDEGVPRTIKGMPMRFCTRCDLLWMEHSPLEETYYERLPVRMEEERIQARVRNARDRIRMMRRFVPLESVCDIGAGEGTFLRVLKAEGCDDAFGIEPGAQGVAEATADGVEVLQGGIRDLPKVLKKHPARVFTMFHVIEHLDDPVADMRLLFAAMEPGAFLVAETPDLHGYTPSKIGDEWKLFYSEHRTLFSRRSLRSLLGKTGFRVVTQGRRDFDPWHIPLSDALFRLGWSRGGVAQGVKNVPMCRPFDYAQGDTFHAQEYRTNVTLRSLRFLLSIPLTAFLSALVRMLRRYDYQWIIVRRP